MRFLILLLLFTTFAYTKDGGKETGNGGDSYTIEFASIAQSIVKHWNELEISKDLPVSKERFEFAVKNTSLHSSTEPLMLGEFEVDAKNYPPLDEKNGVILISRTRWDLMKDDLVKKTALVFHEYLGILELNAQRFDDFYEVSGRNFEKLKGILNQQTHVNLNFVCLIQTWNSELQKPMVSETLEITDVSSDKWLSIQKKEFEIRISTSISDYFAKTITSELRYDLYSKNRGELPDYKNPISSGAVAFKGAKTSLRISNAPEIQLVCYRNFVGFN